MGNREGYVTKCGANFLNSSERLSIERSPAKPMLTFVYTHYSSARYILPKETHRISQKNDTFRPNAQFPELTSIRCKFSRVEEHVTKYCYVMLDRIGHVVKCSRTYVRDSLTVFAMPTILWRREIGRGVSSTEHEQHKPRPTNACMIRQHVYDRDVMGKTHIFCNG